MLILWLLAVWKKRFQHTKYLPVIYAAINFLIVNMEGLYAFPGARASRILMRSTNQTNDVRKSEAACAHTHNHITTTHQTSLPHLLLSQRQTAGWKCRSAHNRPTSPPRARLGQICCSFPSLSPGVLGEKNLQAAVGLKTRQMPATQSNGRSGEWGRTWLLLRSHAPWHACVTLLQVIQMITAERVQCPSAPLTQRPKHAPPLRDASDTVDVVCTYI